MGCKNRFGIIYYNIITINNLLLIGEERTWFARGRLLVGVAYKVASGRKPQGVAYCCEFLIYRGCLKIEEGI